MAKPGTFAAGKRKRRCLPPGCASWEEFSRIGVEAKRRRVAERRSFLGAFIRVAAQGESGGLDLSRFALEVRRKRWGHRPRIEVEICCAPSRFEDCRRELAEHGIESSRRGPTRLAVTHPLGMVKLLRAVEWLKPAAVDYAMAFHRGATRKEISRITGRVINAYSRG